MQKILNIFNALRNFITRHKLYANLHALVVSMVLSVILMQAGSLFLYDYIPDDISVIHQAYKDQTEWKLAVFKLESNANESDVFNHLNEVMNSLDGATFFWAKNQQDSGLANAYKKLDASHQRFSQARVYGESRADMIERGREVVSAYEEFVNVAEKDIEIKLSLVSLLQLICLFLVFCIAASIMLASWSILINRLTKIVAIMPNDLNSGGNADQYQDEFDILEKLVAEMSARLEALEVETKWTNKSSAEKVRKMILSQAFLFKLTKLIGASGLSETTLKKTLYSLERALSASNVALVFSEKGSWITAQRALYSSYWPLSFDESMFDESLNSLSVKHTTKLVQGQCVQCVTMPLSSSNGWLGILLLETEANRYFEDTELQLLEVTAQLLALSMGLEAKEQESRRIALLEERAVIARELHDSLAQSLSYMKFQLARLQTNFGAVLIESGADTIVNDMREGLDNAYRELRELLTTFRVQMDVRGLDHVLKEAIEEFSQRSSLSIALDNRLQECRLSVNEEFHLLHIIREALSNIVRHSGAKKVTIALILQSTGDVIVTVDDDGVGVTFDKNKPHHYGLAIMTERASCLEGTIEILPRRRGGTRIRLLFHPK
ncbi:MAG: histidine kinase [Methylotenera sp.]|nr:histidine kinase [Methylotenera sp.]